MMKNDIITLGIQIASYGGGNRPSLIILSAYSLVRKLAAGVVARPNRVRK